MCLFVENNVNEINEHLSIHENNELQKNLDQKVKRAKHHKHTQHGSDRYILDIRPFHKAYFGCRIL